MAAEPNAEIAGMNSHSIIDVTGCRGKCKMLTSAAALKRAPGASAGTRAAGIRGRLAHKRASEVTRCQIWPFDGGIASVTVVHALLW